MLTNITFTFGFKRFLCSPLFGEDSHFDYYNIFSKGLKPPTSNIYTCHNHGDPIRPGVNGCFFFCGDDSCGFFLRCVGCFWCVFCFKDIMVLRWVYEILRDWVALYLICHMKRRVMRCFIQLSYFEWFEWNHVDISCLLPSQNLRAKAPENGWLEEYFSFGMVYFLGLC